MYCVCKTSLFIQVSLILCSLCFSKSHCSSNGSNPPLDFIANLFTHFLFLQLSVQNFISPASDFLKTKVNFCFGPPSHMNIIAYPIKYEVSCFPRAQPFKTT